MLTNMEKEKLEELIEEVKSKSDFDFVHRLIRIASNRINYLTRLKFREGNKVLVSLKKFGKEMPGEVIKVMSKNIKVKLDNGQIWKVSPTFLRKENSNGKKR